MFSAAAFLQHYQNHEHGLSRQDVGRVFLPRSVFQLLYILGVSLAHLAFYRKSTASQVAQYIEHVILDAQPRAN